MFFFYNFAALIKNKAIYCNKSSPNILLLDVYPELQPRNFPVTEGYLNYRLASLPLRCNSITFNFKRIDTINTSGDGG